MQKQITSAEIEQHNIDALPDTVEIIYPEDKLDARKDEKQNAHLDLNYANLKIDIANISDLKGEDFTLARRNGFGTSDSSVILGVNPYKTLSELIIEKSTPTISAEEKELAKNVAIRKGNALEPLIIDKFSKQFQQDTWKPMDMYEHKDFPYLKFNFDGVTGKPGAYYPAEIKVVTARGEKHYNPGKAYYIEGQGFNTEPADVTKDNISIQSKALHYGIPVYYYTQLQQEILGLGASFGYLCTLPERSWDLIVYKIHRDEATINALKVEGYKAWERVLTVRKEKGYGPRLGRY